jgi:DNA-binding CsgD family transcriptional regulator
VRLAQGYRRTGAAARIAGHGLVRALTAGRRARHRSFIELSFDSGSQQRKINGDEFYMSDGTPMTAETCAPDTDRPSEAHRLFGREREVAHIGEVLDGSRASRSGVLVLRGEAGTGKSALLAHAREAGADMCLLAGGGVESEAQLPFAALHQLLRPVIHAIPALPAIQAKALRGALGMGPAGEHRFVVSVAVLSLIAEAAEHGPVLCLVDDAQWLDEASAETLAFVARRLQAERVVILFAARDDDGRDFDAPALPELRLGGLSAEAAAALLDRHGGRSLAPDVRDQLVDATAGNPLALIEISQALTDAERTGAEPLRDPLPVSASIERAFLNRAGRLPQPTQSLLLVAAADDTGELAIVLDAAARLGMSAEDLDAAESAGLARARGSLLELRHPLLRSALYHGAPASKRRLAHAALADAMTDATHADRRAWHRAAASIAPDPPVVAELEQAARRARARGGFAAASRAFERAATLAADDAQRARQLSAAGEDAWVAGRSDRAMTLLETARRLTADPLLAADIDRVRVLIGLNAGVPADACRLALGAARAVAAADGRRALRLLGIASLAATYACDGEAIVAIGEAAARAAVADAPVDRLLSHHLRGLGAYYAGDFPAAAPLLRAALELAEQADAETAGGSADVLSIAAAVGLFLGDDRAVHRLHSHMVARARDTGALGLLTWALPRLAVSDIWAGRWGAAVAGLNEAVGLSDALHQHVLTAYLLSELAIVAALRGDEEECRSLAARSMEMADARRLQYVGYIANSAVVGLELSLGRSETAFQRSRAMAATPGLDFWDALDRIEAAARAGHRDVARESLEDFSAWAQSSGSAWARPVAAHCRALVSDDPDVAERLFREAVALHASASRPFERARTELAFGEFLRRARRRREARGHLRAALESFEALGSRLWADRARAELRASGQSARRRDASTLDELTAQELQIAQRVAEGLSNRDIAAQFFLSPRTIDFHLRNVFRKLGVSSRMELARLELDGAR